MALNDKASELAKELLNSAQISHEQTFQLRDNPSEEIVVLVVRRAKRTKTGSLTEWSQRIQMQGSGLPCDKCGGSGRV